ncbi:MAG: hypothetical protein IV100_05740 [Myxococcales bacterium]|nr:hypothetical protein [Myxococcales bacterium]
MVEFVIELVVEIFGEALIQGGYSAFGEAFRAKPKSPWVAGIGQLTLGAVTGALSLLVWPHLFLQQAWARWALLIFTPLGVGSVLWAVRKLRERPNPEVAFQRGVVFAFGMSLIRLAFGS